MKKTSKFIAAMAVALTVAAPIAANAATSATGAYWASGGRITQYNTGGYAEHTGSVIKSVRSTSYGSVTNTVTGARRADSFAQGSGYVTNSATDAGGTVYQTHR